MTTSTAIGRRCQLFSPVPDDERQREEQQDRR